MLPCSSFLWSDRQYILPCTLVLWSTLQYILPCTIVMEYKTAHAYLYFIPLECWAVHTSMYYSKLQYTLPCCGVQRSTFFCVLHSSWMPRQYILPFTPALQFQSSSTLQYLLPCTPVSWSTLQYTLLCTPLRSTVQCVLYYTLKYTLHVLKSGVHPSTYYHALWSTLP